MRRLVQSFPIIRRKLINKNAKDGRKSRPFIVPLMILCYNINNVAVPQIRSKGGNSMDIKVDIKEKIEELVELFDKLGFMEESLWKYLFAN